MRKIVGYAHTVRSGGEERIVAAEAEGFQAIRYYLGYDFDDELRDGVGVVRGVVVPMDDGKFGPLALLAVGQFTGRMLREHPTIAVELDFTLAPFEIGVLPPKLVTWFPASRPIPTPKEQASLEGDDLKAWQCFDRIWELCDPGGAGFGMHSRTRRNFHSLPVTAAKILVC